jgi:hypothetical protein
MHACRCRRPSANNPTEVRIGLPWPARDIACPNSRFEAALLVELMHARVLAAALKQNVMTVLSPSRCDRRANYGAPIASTPKFRMRHNIFEKAVLTAGAQEIWCSNEHAGCNDFSVRFGYEERDVLARQYLQPNSFGSFLGLNTAAHLRDLEKCKERRKIGGLC